HRPPAENSHHQFGGKAMIAAGKLCEGGGMEQFRGVRLFALDPQQNFESYGSRRRKRNGHCTLLSQIVSGFGPITVDEFARGHSPFALELNFDELQGRASVIVFFLPASN